MEKAKLAYLDQIPSILPRSRKAVMIFGSAARGDMQPQSDVDILVIHHGLAGTVRRGVFNISYYSPSHIKDMAKKGSLFVRHLIMDGLVYEDPSGILRNCLDAYRKPESYQIFEDEIRAIMPLFDLHGISGFINYQAFKSVAFYCLRTLVYAKADEFGILNFSLKELAKESGWNEVVLLELVKRQPLETAEDSFLLLVRALELNLNVVCRNEFGTIEAYAVNCHDSHPIVISLAMRLLSGSTGQLNYDLLSPLTFAAS